MNLAQIMPVISGFLLNPKEGVLQLEKNVIPLWQDLEKSAGGELAFNIRKNNDTGTISIALYKVIDGSAMTLWKAYSLPQLVDEFKNNKTLTIDGTISANIDAEQPAGTAAATAAATGTDTTTDRATGEA